MSIVLVGEMNPYGSHPRHALFDEPPNSAGGRLRRRILGMRSEDYLALARYNLCVGAWDLARARERAREITASHPGDAIVMLGRKVAGAFDRSGMGAFEVEIVRTFFQANSFVALPHPSGRCLVWNEPGSIPRARSLLRQVDPTLALATEARS